LGVFVLSSCYSKQKTANKKKGEKMRKQKQSSTQLKVVQTNTDLEAKKKDNDHKEWSEFNDACKDFFDNEVKSLFEKTKMENNAKLYHFMFHLTQNLVWDKLPVGQLKRAIDLGVQDGAENYLDYIKDTYNLKSKEAVNAEAKTIN
jgi:hypothetical protein